MSLFFKKGIGAIDAVIGTALLLIVFLGIFGVFRLATVIVSHGKARVGAIALSGEQMEFLRSLSYDDVGVSGGIPSGAIDAEESLSLNNVDYTRRTFIQYFDAPQDGLGGADENSIITDYKIAKVEVSWNVRGEERKVTLVSNIVPKGIETSGGGGTLKITALNSLGSPVVNARVDIENDDTDPVVDFYTFTNSSGEVNLPGAPSSSGYEITVSKSGYSTDGTYSITGENPNPNPGHLTVLEGETTSGTFAIDLLSTKTIIAEADMPFSMRGAKTIGEDEGGSPVYKYQENLATDSSGEITISDLEWDNYIITIDNTALNLDISESCEPQPRPLLPGANITTTLSFSPHTDHTLLVDVRDDSGDLLASSTVRLYRTGFDEAKETSSCGQVFWSSLSEGTIAEGDEYSVEVSLSGYETDITPSVDVSGQSTLNVILNSL